jgi:hypothetical protein
MSQPAQRFINCHTHIFTGESVPPYLAKTYLPWPFYCIFSIRFILNCCRWWYLGKKSPKRWKYKWWYKSILRIFTCYRSFLKRYFLTNTLVLVINFIISYHAIIYFAKWILGLFIKPNKEASATIEAALKYLDDYYLFYNSDSSLLRFATVAFTILFIAWGRSAIFFLLKKAWSFLSILPNKKTLEFLARYINIGRFAYYRKQGRIFIKLKDQYPQHTGFVLLPMDMEYMNAGTVRPTGSFEVQMKELAAIKANKRYNDCVYPFVFIDPRRKQVGDKIFFTWSCSGNGTVRLESCFIQEYIEGKKFSGFKIYPALGYYPFDELLLPLWKYAADNKIPILTHTIRGTIFYRGRKKKEWNYHPVFKQANGKAVKGELLLPELKNSEFCNNFTHPLNYLCLVEEKLLRVVVSNCSQKIKELFGYTNQQTPLQHNLAELKLCFGHFGGDDEWEKYFEKDRDNYTATLVTKPGMGIEFIKDGPVDDSMFTLEQIWKDVDWYSIICSMMLQYPNLYADISYIVHNEKTFPLLKQTLKNDKLKKRVLFGTDFYVVRNHKSEKDMLIHLQTSLSRGEFHWIAKNNPIAFLNLC